MERKGDQNEKSGALDQDHKQSFLQPIKTMRVSEIAVEQITALIEEGRLEIGDQLPGERELIHQLGVSRASVREALRILELRGILDVQPGKGTFVIGTAAQSDISPNLQSWLAKHKDEVIDVLHVRGLLESEAAYLAAQFASKADIAELREAIAKMASCIEENAMTEATHADRTFHRLLYEASGNRFLKLIGDGIVTTLFDYRHSVLRIPFRARQSLNEHTEIVNAIAAGDPNGAQDATQKHMSSVREVVLALQADGRKNE